MTTSAEQLPAWEETLAAGVYPWPLWGRTMVIRPQDCEGGSPAVFAPGGAKGLVNRPDIAKVTAANGTDARCRRAIVR